VKYSGARFLATAAVVAAAGLFAVALGYWGTRAVAPAPVAAVAPAPVAAAPVAAAPPPTAIQYGGVPAAPQGAPQQQPPPGQINLGPNPNVEAMKQVQRENYQQPAAAEPDRRETVDRPPPGRFPAPGGGLERGPSLISV
jgi:hypothetical protein